jgi:hypothetical protein
LPAGPYENRLEFPFVPAIDSGRLSLFQAIAAPPRFVMLPLASYEYDCPPAETTACRRSEWYAKQGSVVGQMSDLPRMLPLASYEIVRFAAPLSRDLRQPASSS